VGQHFAIVAVDHERDRHHLAAPAGNEENIGTPALVRRRLLHLAQMGAAVTAMDARGEHQSIQPHDPADSMTAVLRPAGLVHHRAGPPGAVARTAVRHRADLPKHRFVVGPPIKPFGS
jgi:hypothetical protein